MDQGSIIEEGKGRRNSPCDLRIESLGNHDQLMATNGVYRSLVETQNIRMKTDESDPLDLIDDLEDSQGTRDSGYWWNMRLFSHSIPWPNYFLEWTFAIGERTIDWSQGRKRRGREVVCESHLLSSFKRSVRYDSSLFLSFFEDDDLIAGSERSTYSTCKTRWYSFLLSV